MLAGFHSVQGAQPACKQDNKRQSCKSQTGDLEQSCDLIEQS